MIRKLVIIISISGLAILLYMLFSSKQKPLTEMNGKEMRRKKLL